MKKSATQFETISKFILIIITVQERAKEIVYDTATKASIAHTCPSCERNFIIVQTSTDKDPNFCIH